MEEYCVNVSDIEPYIWSGEGHKGGSSRFLFNSSEPGTDRFNPKVVSSEKTTLSVMEYLPGGRTKEHTHDNAEQGYYILEGKMRATLGGKEYLAEPGHSLFAPRGVAHSYENAGDGKLVFLIITCSLDD